MLGYEDIESRICFLSKNLEEVLKLLLVECKTIKEDLNSETRNRTLENQNLREDFTKELEGQISKEKEERIQDYKGLKEELNRQKSNGEEKFRGLQISIEAERKERIQEDKNLNERCGKEIDIQRQNLKDVNDWIKTENDKRMEEAEALKVRLEREKQELRDYIEKDNKALQDKMNREEEERRLKEKEMSDKLNVQQQASENEIIQLYKKMANENKDRKIEIEELRAKLEKEKDNIREQLTAEKNALEERLTKENVELRSRLENQGKGLSDQMETNHGNQSIRINDLKKKLSELNKESGQAISDLNSRLLKDSKDLRHLMSQPLSILFDAYRTEDYDEGGEGFLTFHATKINLGGGMDAKSGVFTAPVAGAYSFTIHVCTADLSKALLSLRHNGNQIASFYDQNHESNNKNSMLGQSVIIDLEIGDKIQVYLFTNTGLLDKRNNHLTHFTGVLLRPKIFFETSCE